MLDQVQHDIVFSVVFVGHSRLDRESIGRRGVASDEEQDTAPAVADVWGQPEMMTNDDK
ncbi:hypothetical protein [Inquilinus sp. CAU 1745]|uniref:hypothetical protein n=1 Tax=Inquilinus sp. CAU 1745 TaxID=3140369 RepID=UPI00325B62B6